MKRKDEFYIGYVEKIPMRTKGALKRIVFFLLLIFILSAVLFSTGQNEFKNSTFELGQVNELTGTLYKYPTPMLRVQVAENSYKNIVLLGFGKFGADKEIQEIEAEVSQVEGMEITLKGTLIYYDGKTLLQLEKDHKPHKILKKSRQSRPLKFNLGSAELEGEIIDPKCYFGVMKPGFGKIHRSCAVRCISGGIPPVFLTSNEHGESSYYIITDMQGNAINKDILPYVGKPIKISGQLEQIEDWLVLKTDISKIVELNKESKIY